MEVKEGRRINCIWEQWGKNQNMKKKHSTVNQQCEHPSEKAKQIPWFKMKDIVCKNHEVIFLMNRQLVRPFLEFCSIQKAPNLKRNVKKLGEGSEDSHKDNELVVK